MPHEESHAIIHRLPRLLLPDEPLCCPEGHPIAQQRWTIDEHPRGGERCHFRPPPGDRGECGVTFFWWRFDDGSHLVVEVDWRVLQAMERERLTPHQTRDYLGLGGPIVTNRIARRRKAS